MPTYKHVMKRTDGTTHHQWRYRFTCRGKRYSGSAPKGANTEKMARAMEADHAARVGMRLDDGPMPTVETFSKRFLAYQAAHTKPLTRMQQVAVVANHILPKLGKLSMDQVAQKHIDDLMSSWAATAGAKTVNTRLGTLRRMFALAVEWDVLARIPRMKMRKVHAADIRFLSFLEAEALLAVADDTWRSMVMVALRTGLRVGELRGLQWGDIDLDRTRLAVKRTDPGRLNMASTSPKGGNARHVPLTPDAVAALVSVRPPHPKGDAWVWPAPRWRGTQIDRARSEKGCFQALRRFAKRAGIKDCGWHTLRHTYASWLVMRGIPMRVIQKFMGHSSIVQTERYSHLAPDFGHESVALLDLPLDQGATKALPEGPRE